MVNSRLIEIYGNPDTNGDGQADLKWEVANIVRIKPPYPMWWGWYDEPVPVVTMKIHRKCADSLEDALTMVGDRYTPEERKWYGLDQCGGTYSSTLRTVRGSENVLSTHCYGCAIDLSTIINRLGRKYDESQRMMPREVMAIFKKLGWTNGAFWGRPDGQHFQKVP